MVRSITTEFAATSVVLLACALANAQSTKRISVDSSGVQGDSHSVQHSLSANGRFIAFDSEASNLVLGDTNNRSDIFVRDTQTEQTTLVSVASDGTQSNDDSFVPSISADGRFVAFHSHANNLVPEDADFDADIFVHDLLTGVTTIVSVDSAGNQSSGFNGRPSISATGRFVAFDSYASDLVLGDTNGDSDTFVHDRQTGVTTCVSVDSLGTPVGGGEPSISADGRFVAFASGDAGHLVPGDSNGFADIFVRDQIAGQTTRVSVDSTGAQSNGSSAYPSMSADGHWIAFRFDGSNLVPGDTNGFWDIFAHNTQTGLTVRVSVDSAAMQSNNYSSYPSISADGRFVAYSSYASNLVAGDSNQQEDVFVRDVQSGTTARVSVASGGSEGDFYSSEPSISTDGRYVVFHSGASNLLPGDTNGCLDIFMRDRGPVPPSVYCTAGTTSHGCGASIDAAANPSVTLANPCIILATGVEAQQSGMLFYGIDNAGFTPVPWATGSSSLLCVKPPTQRTPIQNSGGTQGACDGSFLLDWRSYQASHPAVLGSPWSAGDKVYVQAWFRDPTAVKSTNLSNAVVMTYAP